MDRSTSGTAAAQEYVDAIDPDRRALFDRVHGIVTGEYPDVEVRLSYAMPTYRVGTSRLHVGVWRHGVSFYGWNRDRDGGLTARHPDLVTGVGTIRLRADDPVDDRELRAFVRATLGG